MTEKRIFNIASEADVVAGRTTDVYFERTLKILRARGIDPRVTMEVRAKELPNGSAWAIFAGLEEALLMLERLNAPLEVRSIEEGRSSAPATPSSRSRGRTARSAPTKRRSSASSARRRGSPPRRRDAGRPPATGRY